MGLPPIVRSDIWLFVRNRSRYILCLAKRLIVLLQSPCDNRSILIL